MGVIYKLTDEVVHFIVQQRTAHAGLSCRELAQAVKEKFQINVSKSSIHDVLKDANIVTPRGRKPKFKIPIAKKEQIKAEVAKSYEVGAGVPMPVTAVKPSFPDGVSAESQETPSVESISVEPPMVLRPDPVPPRVEESSEPQGLKPEGPFARALREAEELSGARPSIYEGAAKIFLKAAWWDLGIFDEQLQISEQDWVYYLTYARGIQVCLQDGQSYLAEFPVPLERCLREAMDGLVSNIIPWVVAGVSDEELFKSSMTNERKIQKIQIVDCWGHIIVEFDQIRDFKRKNNPNNVIFVESAASGRLERCKDLFFSQDIEIAEDMFFCSGFDYKNKDEQVSTICCENNYPHTGILIQAAERLNQMFLRNEQGLLVRVKVCCAS